MATRLVRNGLRDLGSLASPAQLQQKRHVRFGRGAE